MPSRVAVVGASGFFGRVLADVLVAKEHDVTAVTRDNFEAARAGRYDVVVNAAMPSRRFWAKQHPDLDFIETVQKTSDLLNGWRFDRFIQISSVSARCERHTVYGRHKAAAEVLCERPDCLVVRFSNLYGRGLTKGAIIDISKGSPVYVSGESRYAFTDVHFAAGWVSGAMGRYDVSGVIEVGAKNTLALKDLAAHMKKDAQFSGPVEVQEILNPDREFPDAREVLRFASTLS
ncbi:MAG: NAD(P)-dependent oxidoreductase [Acidobacteria bacterium]|nr:MAG: NAD(P)-dependent oxidoreductase [Acidobacteriota bacterium]